MKRILSVFALIIFSVVTGLSQVVQINELRLPHEVLGYKVLKCDLHMHTIFSDGIVWPTVRVNEAVSEGLDAIAITDHFEYRPRLKEMNVSDTTSRNSAYRLAKKNAEIAGLLLIPAGEITKSVPPGHFNALFIKDADKFVQYINKDKPGDPSTIRAALKEAMRQNAFIFWNHPWYKVKTNESVWFPIIDSLYNEGYFKGIEVVNTNRYDPVVFGWSQSKHLTILANTDSHTPISLEKGQFRTMNIVFAKERTIESIHEALLEGRSVAYSNNFLYGDKIFLEAIFRKSVKVETKSNYGKTASVTFFNSSSLPYNLSLKETKNISFGNKGNVFSIPPKGEISVILSNTENFIMGEKITLNIKIDNLQTGPDTPLSTELSLTL